MPHQSFGTVRNAEVEREPISFDFGMFSEESFTVIPDPSLGDTLDLYDAPEPSPDSDLASVAVLVRFIRRMIAPADKARFDQALYRIPSSHGFLIVDAAAWIVEQITPFDLPPAGNSSGGRQHTGTTSKTQPGGNGH